VDVAAEGGELLLLQGADPSRGIEEDDVDVGPVVKGVGNGAAGVARGGPEDVELRMVLRQHVL